MFYLVPLRKHRWGYGELEMLQVVESTPACGPAAAPWGFEHPAWARQTEVRNIVQCWGPC